MKKTSELFDRWNEQKKRLEFEPGQKKHAKVWEIWWYWEWINIGREISKDGKFLRPCLIFQSHVWNWLMYIIPITSSQLQAGKYWSIEIQYAHTYNLKRKSRLLCQQSKCIDPKRLLESISSTKKIRWSFFGYIQQILLWLLIKQKTP